MTIKCEEGRQCARTHCPWPLNAAPVFEQALSNVQLLHEEPQVRGRKYLTLKTTLLHNLIMRNKRLILLIVEYETIFYIFIFLD